MYRINEVKRIVDTEFCTHHETPSRPFESHQLPSSAWQW